MGEIEKKWSPLCVSPSASLIIAKSLVFWTFCRLFCVEDSKDHKSGGILGFIELFVRFYVF